MTPEIVAIKSLKPDPKNARKHDQKNLDAIKGSLKAFGQQKPIVVTKDGTVLAGNGTLAAAKALGWKEIAVVRTSLTGDEAKAYALADNRSAELAAWDDAQLSETLKDLDAFDLAAIGFDAAFIQELNAQSLPGDEDDASSEKKPKVCPNCGHEF